MRIDNINYIYIYYIYLNICINAFLVRDRGAIYSADLGTSSKESFFTEILTEDDRSGERFRVAAHCDVGQSVLSITVVKHP